MNNLPYSDPLNQNFVYISEWLYYASCISLQFCRLKFSHITNLVAIQYFSSLLLIYIRFSYSPQHISLRRQQSNFFASNFFFIRSLSQIILCTTNTETYTPRPRFGFKLLARELAGVDCSTISTGNENVHTKNV